MPGVEPVPELVGGGFGEPDAEGADAFLGADNALLNCADRQQ